MTEFDRLRAMLLRHPNPEIQRCILLGYSPFLADEPYLFPLDLLSEGMLILAPTGSGKSSYFIDPLIASIAHHNVSICCINFKESAVSRENARISAHAGGKKFAYFTTQEEYPSHCINLVQNLLSTGNRRMTAMLRGEIATSSMGQNHGRGYGKSHYYSLTLAAVAALLRPEMLPVGHQNFRHIAKLLFEPKKLLLPGIFEEAIRETATDIFTSVCSLSDLNNLNNQKGIDPGEHIDFDRFAQPDSNTLIFLELPYGSRPEAAYLTCQTAIAKLSYALARMPASSRLTHLLIIDDAEPAFGPQLSQLFHVARSKGLGIVISIQGKHQAATGTDDYWKSLESYAATKVLMGVEDTDLFDYINKTAGRVRRARLNWRVPVQGDLDFGQLGPMPYMPGECYTYDSANYYYPPYETMAVSMIEEARFEGNNQIMLASARGDMAFIRVRKNAGPWHHHGRTIPVQMKRHITKETYAERSSASPPAEPGSVIVTATDWLAELFNQYGRRPGRVEETWKTRGKQDERGRARPRADNSDQG
jgi:hypothetical protein